jgi:hypothetical protein
VLVSRLLDLVLRGGRDRRLKEELQAHLDQLTEDHIARGLPPDEARLAARKTFGGVDQIKEVYRDQRGVPLLHALTQDVRLGFRLLGRDRGFALTAVLVLGVGIGVNNLFFTVVYGHTMRGMPMAAPERVLSIQTVDQRGAERGLSAPEVADLRAGTRNFRGFAVFAVQSVSVADPGRPPDRLLGAYVSADAFAAIGVQPLLGRSFRADDGAGGPAVALVGEGAWQARYGGDPGTLGRSILINGTPTTLVGVMPDRSGFPSSAEVWLPLTQMPGMATAPRDARTLTVAGRVRDEASVADARLEAEALIGRFAVDHAATNSGIRARVMTIDERFFPGLYHPAWIAFLSAGFLIAVIACANVANLMLSRSLHRARELAIRTSRAPCSRCSAVCSVSVSGCWACAPTPPSSRAGCSATGCTTRWTHPSWRC